MRPFDQLLFTVAVLACLQTGCQSGTELLDGDPLNNPSGSNNTAGQACRSTIDALVYWPVPIGPGGVSDGCEGIVRGVLPASLRARGAMIRVRTLGTETIIRTSEAERLDFAICASSDDALSIAACTSVPCASEWTELGSICTLPTPLPTISFTCCQPAGLCASESALECPADSPVATPCAEERDCWPLSGINIELEPSALRWSAERHELIGAPGTLPAAALVVARVQSRRSSALVQEDGSFAVSIDADGPITVSATDSQGNRSPDVTFDPGSN